MNHPRNIVGPNVRRLRTARELSQEQLALKCQLIGWDISRDGIAKIEGRIRWVADFELVYLCKVFCVRPEVLLGQI